MFRTIFAISLLLCSQLTLASATVFKITVEQAADEVYDKVYAGLEAAKFFVVFEPNIGRNLASFEKRWGENYNRNSLTSLRAMVFCNAWYANQVSNLDPDMLGLCPLHVTLYENDGRTSVLFNRPTAIAVGSDAMPVLKELEQEVIEAIEKSLN